MKKTLTLLIFLLSVFFVSCGIVTTVPTSSDVAKKDEEEIVVENDFSYTVVNEEARIEKYVGTSSYVVIPETLGGYPVTVVKEGTFEDKKSATVSGEGYFEMLEAEVQNGDTDKTIYIPSTIKDIEEGAFCGDGNVYITDGKVMPEGWKDATLKGDARIADNVYGNTYFNVFSSDCIIRDGVIYFYNSDQQGYFIVDCFSFSPEIVIPDSINGIPVNNIGSWAFSRCRFLKKITFGKNINYIFHDSFVNCTSLEEIVFDSPLLTKILQRSFSGCSSLKKIKLPENLSMIGDCAFENCGTVEELIIPNTVTKIYASAFSGTKVSKVIYGSSKEDFDRIEKVGSTVVFQDSEIEYKEKAVIDGVISIEEAHSVDVGTGVTVRGYVAHYYMYGGEQILLVDEKNENGIIVYFQAADRVDELPAVGAYIEVKGKATVWSGLREITNIDSIEVIGHKEIQPIKVTVEELNKNADKYFCRYIEFEGVVKSSASYYTYFEGLDFCYYDRSRIYFEPSTKVIFRGTVATFGTSYELLTLSSNIEIIK